MAYSDKDLKYTEHAAAWDELDEVPGEGGKVPLDKVVAVRIHAGDWMKLEEEARGLGVGPTTLVRMWILERLRRHRGSTQDAFELIDLFLQRAFREGILLQTPRELAEDIPQGASFFGNTVI